MKTKKPSNKELVFSLVNKIPKGKIVSFGQIGNLINLNPRVVGFIMSGMNKSEMGEIPWHRVVNREGFISSSKLGDKGLLQEALLKSEGVKVKDFQIIQPKLYWYELKLS